MHDLRADLSHIFLMPYNHRRRRIPLPRWNRWLEILRDGDDVAMVSPRCMSEPLNGSDIVRLDLLEMILNTLLAIM